MTEAEAAVNRCLRAFVIHLDSSPECVTGKRGVCHTCYRLASEYIGSMKVLAARL